MAARKQLWHPDAVREKIQASQLVNRLTAHVNGTVELTATQVTAALGLLRKCVPDLAAVQHSGEVTVRKATDLSDDELAAIAARGGKGTPEPEDSARVLN